MTECCKGCLHTLRPLQRAWPASRPTSPKPHRTQPQAPGLPQGPGGRLVPNPRHRKQHVVCSMSRTSLLLRSTPNPTLSGLRPGPGGRRVACRDHPRHRQQRGGRAGALLAGGVEGHVAFGGTVGRVQGAFGGCAGALLAGRRRGREDVGWVGVRACGEGSGCLSGLAGAGAPQHLSQVGGNRGAR